MPCTPSLQSAVIAAAVSPFENDGVRFVLLYRIPRDWDALLDVHARNMCAEDIFARR